MRVRADTSSLRTHDRIAGWVSLLGRRVGRPTTGVTVRLAGGLGNQMFQYAAGRALAKRWNVELRLDLTWLINDPKRAYALDQLCLDDAITLIYPVRPKFELSCNGWVGNLLDSMGLGQCVYRETSFGFDAGLVKRRPPVLIEGYWQSPHYFTDVARQLREEFWPRQPLPVQAAPLLERLRQPGSVGIHVRRGDYVSEPGANAHHGVCALDYYQRALTRLRSLGVRASPVVFSDDVPWVESVFLPRFGGEVVIPEYGLTDFQSLWLMSQAHHQVIANSSFSWWAGWLAERTAGSVTAPSRWFRVTGRDTSDLLPTDWVQM